MAESGRARERQMERDDELCASFFYRGRNMEISQRGRIGRGGGGVGDQFRKANIVYFLSRNGTVEHPHLLRVHHHRNNGVYLRDVKRWLGELRGKDMPDSFAWSYKRKYKSGYVWQDLKDEDLITPISDNEYVLKGSFLQFRSIDGFPSDHTDMAVKTPRGAAGKAVAEHQVASEPKLEQPETIHIEPDRDSLVQTDRRSGDHVDWRMAVFGFDAAARKQQQEEEKQRFRRSYSSRASHVFRNILTCGAADANGAVLMPVRRSAGGWPHRRRSTSDMPPRQQPSQQQGSEGDNSRNSRRSSGGSTGYKPLGAPNCSQCGRQFDPEKFHAHMQSCRGHRGSRRKRRPSTDRVPLRRGSPSEEVSLQSQYQAI